MIEGKTVLAVITARGGSKSVPRKNIRMLAGLPLIAWTIRAGHKSRYIDRLILSSDDGEIIEEARRHGCESPFIRPEELARDDTPGVAPILHALSAIPETYDYVVLLQPTSPLRTAGDIDGCIEMCLRSGAPACVTVTEPGKSPYWIYRLDARGRLEPMTELGFTSARRQDLPRTYALNGAVYVADTFWISRTRTFLTPETAAHIMPTDRSFDVDTELDLMICERMLKADLKENDMGFSS